MTQPSSPDPRSALLGAVDGYQMTQATYVAAALGLADLLAEGPQTSDALARRCGADAPALYRLLRALASRGLFAVDTDGRFQLTPVSELLRSGVPGSLRARVLQVGQESYRAWGELLYSVQTGADEFSRAFGISSWEYRSRNPDANALFNAAMGAFAARRAAAVVTAYDFSRAQTVIDVGGGNGALLAAILASLPGLRGVLFDQAHVTREAPILLSAAGVADRCAIVAGDLLESVPPDGDVFILSTVLHGWDDARAGAILLHCRQALDDAATLLIIDAVVPVENVPHPSMFMDLGMLIANPGGRERTEREWRSLLAATGFGLRRITPLPTGHSVLEAGPV